MKPSEKCIALIKLFEGLRLGAYRDQRGILTIGYGHTGSDVAEGELISEDQALMLLRGDLAEISARVSAELKVTVTQEQFDALCSFAFNLGAGALQKSTLLEMVNAGNFSGAADQFPRWCNVRIGGVLQRDPGLTRRRWAERDLFLSQHGEAKA